MRKPIAVSELLAEGKAKLERLKKGAEAADRVLAAVQRSLPPELAAHVFGAVLDADAVLTVLVDGAGFATRVRYALPGLLPGLAETLAVDRIARSVVRVRPRP